MQPHELPGDFKDLIPFMEEWGELETQNERYLRRQTLPMERLTSYYEAVYPRLHAIFEHLDGFPFGTPLPPPEARLFRIVMGMTEVAHAIEVFGQPTVPHIPVGHQVQVAVMTGR